MKATPNQKKFALERSKIMLHMLHMLHMLLANHAPNKVSLLFSTLYIGDPVEKHLLSTLVASVIFTLLSVFEGHLLTPTSFWKSVNSHMCGQPVLGCGHFLSHLTSLSLTLIQTLMLG